MQPGSPAGGFKVPSGLNVPSQVLHSLAAMFPAPGKGGFQLGSPGLISTHLTFGSPGTLGGKNGGISFGSLGFHGITTGVVGTGRLGTVIGSPPGTNSPHPNRK